MTKFLKVSIYSLIILVLLSCKTDKDALPDDFNYGEINDNVYTNKYFDVNVPLSPEWYIVPEDELEARNKKGVEGENFKLKETIQASEVRSAHLLHLYEYKVGTNVPFNPSLMIIAENLEEYPGITSPVAYLENTSNLLMQSGLNQNIVRIGDTREVNGKIFTVMVVDTKLNSGVIGRQEYLTRLDKGFAVNFIISYGDDAQKAALDKMLNGVKY